MATHKLKMVDFFSATAVCECGEEFKTDPNRGTVAEDLLKEHDKHLARVQCEKFKATMEKGRANNG